MVNPFTKYQPKILKSNKEFINFSTKYTTPLSLEDF